MEHKLTGRQQTFIAAYLENGGNGTQAAIRAGCKPASAHVTAARWLRNAKVQAAIESGRARVAERVTVTKADCIERLWELARMQQRDARVCVVAIAEIADILGWKIHKTAELPLGDVDRFADWTNEELEHFAKTGERPARLQKARVQ